MCVAVCSVVRSSCRMARILRTNPAPAASADAFLEHMESSESPRKATRAAGAATAEPLWSHRAAWDELLVPVSAETGRAGLNLGEDWPGRWTATWKTSGDQVSCSVRELIQTPMANADPIRCFSWQRGQRHRPA